MIFWTVAVSNELGVCALVALCEPLLLSTESKIIMANIDP
jgi:hypothetical protein